MSNQRKPDYKGTPNLFYGTYSEAAEYANVLAAEMDKVQKGLTKITKIHRVDLDHYEVSVDGWFDPPYK